MSHSSNLLRDGATLRLHDTGGGLGKEIATLFQHGLGGSEAQTAQAFPAGFRRVTLECRGHGGSEAGHRRPFSLAMFADDVLAAADQAGLDRFVAGGISMGAAIALRLACRHPDRVAGLLLVRPAWVFDKAPANMQPNAEVAGLLLRHGHDPARAMAQFAQSPTATRLRREGPDNLASLLGFFERTDAAAFAQILADIAASDPGIAAEAAAALRTPTLIIGNDLDAIHPLAVAETLAAAIPGATLATAPAKSLDSHGHFAQVQAEIAAFLHTRFPSRSPITP